MMWEAPSELAPIQLKAVEDLAFGDPSIADAAAVLNRELHTPHT